MAALIYANAGDQDAAVAAVTEALTHAHDLGDQPNEITAASATLHVFSCQHAPLPVAVVSGFLSADPLASISFPFAYPDQREEELTMLQTARNMLGDADYDAACARGAAMSYDELVQYILEELAAVTPATVGSRPAEDLPN